MFLLLPFISNSVATGFRRVTANAQLQDNIVLVDIPNENIKRQLVQNRLYEKQCISENCSLCRNACVKVYTRVRAIYEETVRASDDILLSDHRKWGWPHVFVRCLQNMLGVIIFIRIAWITGEVGLGMTIGFIILSFLVSFLTSMSVAAISTEQRVGFFATLSKYSSPAVAAALSVLYVCSNVIAFAAYVVALSETLVNFLRNAGFAMVDGSVNDMRIFSAVFCAAVLAVAVIRSTDYFRIRTVMLALVVTAVLMQFVGLLLPSFIIERRLNSTAFKISDYNPYDEKAMGFVVYFPAVTCVFAGLTIRGSFQRKRDSIFQGSALALVVSSVVYMVSAILEAHFTSTSDLVLAHITSPHHKLHSMTVLRSLPVTVIVLLSCFYCSYTAFVTAAQTVQDVGKSPGLVPGWDKLGRGFGRERSPRIAFAVIAAVGVGLSMIGEFNIIVSIMTIYFLTTFSIFNYAVFMATLKSEKPAYRWYFRWLSLLSSLLCIHIMLAVSWKITNAAIFTYLKFYVFIKWEQSEIKVGRKLVGSSFSNTLKGLRNMGRETDFGYKPQVLLLCGNPAARPALVDFANNIIMGRSLLICGFVIPQPVSSRTYLMTAKVDRQMTEWLANRDISAFAATVANENQADGAATLLQTSGIGKMRPNILMVGFKTNWEKGGASHMDVILGYYEIVLNAFEKNVGVAIFRNSDIGFDLTERMKSKDVQTSADADENGIDTDPYAHCNVSHSSRESSQKASKGVGGMIRTVTSLVRRSNVMPQRTSSREQGVRIGWLWRRRRAPRWPYLPRHPPARRLCSGCDTRRARSGQRPDGGRRRRPHDGGSTDERNTPSKSGRPACSARPSGRRRRPPSAARATDVGRARDGCHSLSGDDEQGKTPQDAEASDNAQNPSNRFQLVSKHSVKDLQDAELIIQLDRFRTKVLRGTIDVWWVREDGGLTLLLAYLLQLPASYLEGARLRVFVEGCRSDRVANEQKHMASLLRKFQVDWSEVNVIGGFNDPPTKTTMDDFQQLVSPFRDGGGAQRGFVSDEELQSLRLKTNRYLRTSELLQQHSRDSDLVVVTMPIPRRSATPAALYLSWLEMLSRNLPPTMLVRGNGTSVLSYFD